MSLLKYRITATVIDEKAYLAAIDNYIKDTMKEVARAFLLAAVARVPVYTGFSRGSFRNLEDIVGSVRMEAGSLRIRNKSGKGANKPTTGSGGNKQYYYPEDGQRVLKNMQTGRQFSTQPSAILVKKGPYRYAFNFGISIKYFNYLDPNIWKALQAGEQAAELKMKELLSEKAFPEITRYTKNIELTEG